MLIRPIIRLIPKRLSSHAGTCPTRKKKSMPCCETSASTSDSKSGVGSAPPGTPGGGGIKKSDLKRNIHSGKVRLGFLPDDWFTFFHGMTGVTGPYLLLFNLTNYMVSKEIYILEHEYYLGLSALVIIIYVTKNFGKDIAGALDKEVDAAVNNMEQGRKDEMAHLEGVIKMAKDAQKRAEGQKMLMDAKKENVAMQVEAVYRERSMMVYRMVRNRMEYHIKIYQAEARIHQRWMIQCILEQVKTSITPEFEKQALNSAIDELAAVASRAK